MHVLALIVCLCPASDTDARAGTALASARPLQAPLPPQAPLQGKLTRAVGEARTCPPGCPCGCPGGQCGCGEPDSDGWRTYRKADGHWYAWRLAPAPRRIEAMPVLWNPARAPAPAPVYQGYYNYCAGGG